MTPRSLVFAIVRYLILIVIALVLHRVLTSRVNGAVLYSTDFATFPVGDDRWVGHEGWTGNSVGESAHGIGTNMVVGLDNSAWIGFGEPSTNRVKVSRVIGPAYGEQLPAKLTWQAVFGISPSLIGGSDAFDIAFYNNSGAFLAALRFHTSYDDFGIWTVDSASETFRGSFYVFNELHLLQLEIDYQQNLWSAFINGGIVFSNAVFASSAAARNAGSYAIEWRVANLQDPGDNWMILDNLVVSAPDIVLTVTNQTVGAARLQWFAPVPGTYQVQVSTNLADWSNLAGAAVQAASAGMTLSYSDSFPPGQHRFYRIRL